MALRLRVRCAQIRVFERYNEDGKPDPDRIAAAATFVSVEDGDTYVDSFQVVEPDGGTFEVGRDYNIDITKVVPWGSES